MRIGTKLTLGVGGVLVCVGIGYGLFYLVVRQAYVRASLADNAHQIAVLVTAARDGGLEPAAIDPLLAALAGPVGLREVTVTAADGRVLLAWHDPAHPGHAADHGPVLRRTEALPGGEHMDVEVTLTASEAGRFSSRNVDVAVVAAVTLALLLIVHRLSRTNVARPLERLTRSVERFGQGDLAARCPPGAPGEVGQLADRFNAMAETISSQTEALIREQAYERSILQNVTSGLVGLDPEGRVTTWNGAMARHHGLSAEEAVGRPVEALCPAVFDPVVAVAVRRMLKGDRERFDLEGMRHGAPGLGERIMDVRGRALADEAGRTYGAVLAVEDRTEQVRLTEQLQHAEKLATIGQLAAGLAHEIGTPLNVISGRAEFVLKKLPEGDDLRRHLTRIVAQIDRISGIVGQMLVFARKRPPRKAPVDVAELVETVVDLLGHPLERAGIALEREVPAGLTLHADPDQMQQVFMNLLINGMQAMVSGGALSVRATSVCVPGRGYAPYVRIDVADTGPGMTEEVRLRIFDPFFTTKEPGRGTGMGLPVAQGIVSAHGGWMEVESAPGRGTCFTIHLPQAGPEPEPAATPEAAA